MFNILGGIYYTPGFKLRDTKSRLANHSYYFTKNVFPIFMKLVNRFYIAEHRFTFVINCCTAFFVHCVNKMKLWCQIIECFKQNWIKIYINVPDSSTTGSSVALSNSTLLQISPSHSGNNTQNKFSWLTTDKWGCPLNCGQKFAMCS